MEKVVVDALTGEVTIVKLSEEELKQRAIDEAAHAAQVAAQAKVQYLVDRKREYPSNDEMIEAVYLNALGDDSKLKELQAKRDEIDAKYPG